MNPFHSPRSRRSDEAAVVRALASALGGGNGGAPSGTDSLQLLREPSLRLGGDELRPSLAAWSRDVSLQAAAGEPILDVPAWVCEITSQHNARDSRVTKQTIYRREKVEFVWQLDVDLHTLETFRWLDGRLTELDVYSDDDRVRAVPFQGVELDLAALWAELEKS